MPMVVTRRARALVDRTTIYHDFTADEIEAQYNLRARRPDFATAIIPDWVERSKRARATLDAKIDLAYGGSDRQRIDLFQAGTADAPTLVYFHGGYWQSGEKAIYSFLAEPFTEHSVNFAVVGYDLCPEISITEISAQARQALAWLWRQASDLGIKGERLTVMGHSAGGHITGMMMGTDWTMFADDLPSDLVKAGIPISPLNDLEPLRFTSLNNNVGMDDVEANAESPMNHPPTTNAPQLMVTGGRETAEFQRQADMYVEAFETASRPIERYVVPDCDHFDELNALVKIESPFFQKSMALITKN